MSVCRDLPQFFSGFRMFCDVIVYLTSPLCGHLDYFQYFADINNTARSTLYINQFIFLPMYF